MIRDIFLEPYNTGIFPKCNVRLLNCLETRMRSKTCAADGLLRCMRDDYHTLEAAKSCCDCASRERHVGTDLGYGVDPSDLYEKTTSG